MYCAHNWQLARQGVDLHDEGSRRGIRTHEATGKALQEVRRYELEENQGLRWAFRFLLATASVVLLTVETLFFEANTESIILMVTTIVLVVASIGLLLIAFDAQRRVKALRLQHGLLPGEALENDLDGGGRLLEDPEWGLTGRPDYVMQSPEGPVPVEVKTGGTPPEPFESHVMQLACYLRLLEADGHPPRYGLITYPDRADRIEWDSDTQSRLRGVLERIAASEATGRADRDHEHPGRCRGCARRALCDQRLV